MTELILDALPIAVSLGATYSVLVLTRRCAELRQRVVREGTERRLLRERLDDTAALFESRLSRLEGVKGYAGSRSSQRRRAADLLRLGGDPLTVAKRCDLPAVELQMLLQLDELRERQPTKPVN